MTSTVPTDILIAQSARPRPITDVARELGLSTDELVLYGESKAKVKLSAAEERPRKAKLVLVTGINPTAAGEGKSTVLVGVAQALRKLGHNTVACLREPSLGPVFGIKGGAAGGGYSQVIPMEDINLHFTGDFHAISAAHNLLSAMLDNHLHQGNSLNIDSRRITWPRTLDMNDRALRNIVIGLGGPLGGVPRAERFVITAASEIMAILALARGPEDLEQRLSRIIVGTTPERQGVTAGELKAPGAMSLLLRDALMPNLVQTLEGGPAFIHCGPFANIAHGCNSVTATDLAMRLADVVVTEAGFGSDLGAEKFFDIKCRSGDFHPDAAILVATVRALKLNGGASREDLAIPDAEAVERGFANLARHVGIVGQYGVPVVVALNHFITDSDEEIEIVRRGCEELGVKAVITQVWEKGGEGGTALAEEVLSTLQSEESNFQPLYSLDVSLKEKIETVARKVYGAEGVDFAKPAARALGEIEQLGLGGVPVCIAKSQYSLSDDPTLLGAPEGFRVNIREVYPSAGAGFVVALAGSIMTMPGLGKSPAAEKMKVSSDGSIEGLF